MFDVELRLDSRCQLAEGISWISDQNEANRGAFVFVDIHAQEVHSYSLNGGHRVWCLPERIGWLIPVASGDGYLAGMQSGFARLWLEPEIRFVWLNRVFEDWPELRLNDAKADAAGNIWAGSLNNDDESRSEGCLFRLSPAGELTVVDDGYCVANGPAISPDGRTFLHTDSARRTIFAFDFDAAAGTLKNKRIWKIFATEEGYPDGMNFDASGNLWVAHWGAGYVSCFSPTGILLRRVGLPVSQVTNVAFGGESLDRLFVTSARIGLEASQLAQEPLAGGLFEINTHGVVGMSQHRFAA